MRIFERLAAIEARADATVAFARIVAESHEALLESVGHLIAAGAFDNARVRQIVAQELDARRLVCAQPGCDLRAEQPQVCSCTRSDCPMPRQEAA